MDGKDMTKKRTLEGSWANCGNPVPRNPHLFWELVLSKKAKQMKYAFRISGLLLVFFLVAIVVLYPSSIMAQVPADGLVGYYHFNGNANDYSGNDGPDGVVHGATLTVGANGLENGAYLFDGNNDFINFGDYFNDVTVPFSLGVWIRQEATAHHSGIFYSDGCTNCYAGFRLDTSGEGLTISYGDGGQQWSSNRRSYYASALGPPGEWTHVVCVVRGPTDMSIYMNAEEVPGSYSGTGGPMVHNSTSASAGFSPHTQIYFTGALDELFLYDRELSEAEITGIYRGFLSEITSSDGSHVAPVIGNLNQQLAEFNSGPPAPGDPLWEVLLPSQRKADSHIPSHFACVTSSGQVDINGEVEIVAPPLSVEFDVYESNTHIRVFEEKSGEQLDEVLVADFAEPGLYDGETDLPPEGVFLPAGSFVTSHMLHFDTIGNSEHIRSGSITFDLPIIAVCFRAATLDASDDPLGVESTTYPNGMPGRALEIDGSIGQISLSEDRRTLTMTSFVDVKNDQVRVITVSEVVDPLSMPFVFANSYIAGADEVTFDNCGSAWFRWTFELPGFQTARLGGIANLSQQGIVYLNGNQISGTMNNPGCNPDLSDPFDPCFGMQDTGSDLIDEQGRAVLASPTPDEFGTEESSFFVTGENELVFGVVGDAGYFSPVGMEFQAWVDYTEPVSAIGDPEDPVSAPGKTTIRFTNPYPSRSAIELRNLQEGQIAEVSVYDLRGHRIRQLFDGPVKGGTLMMSWDGRSNTGESVAAGVYFVRAISGGDQVTKKMILAP